MCIPLVFDVSALMSLQPDDPLEHESLEAAWQVDRLCDEFEEECLAGRLPVVERFLERVDVEQRESLLAELLLLEFDYRRQLGESPSLKQALERFSSSASLVRSVFSRSYWEADTLPHVEDHSPSPTPGSNRFRNLRPHARGGLGQVWLADDVELGREVALKDIRETHADDPQNQARFVREAKITGKLEHPGIVPVYGLGRYANGRPFYAMKLIRGNSLKAAIKKLHADPHTSQQHRLELRKLLGRFIEVCNAVAYAHSRGVLHRDLKPENVMLGEFGETLLVDWGLAKPLDHSREQSSQLENFLDNKDGEAVTATVFGSVIGTPHYMSPEQAEGCHDQLSNASDVYSLGATLYCLLTGHPAFPTSADLGSIMHNVRTGDFLSPRQRNPHVPAALEAICLRAMSLKPADRYVSAEQLAEDVENWLSDEPVVAYREPALQRMRRWSRRNRSGVRAGLISLAAIAALSTAAGMYWWRLPGKLVILGAPSNAQIEVEDRTYRIEGQRSEISLRSGAHLVRVSAPDHESQEHELLIERGQEKVLPGFRRDQGFLSAECDPLGSEIEVDGVAYGSRIRDLQLDSGSHLVRAWRDGHFDSPTKRITLTKNNKSATRFFLDRGILWMRESFTTQSMVIPVFDKTGTHVTGIIHDELGRVVCLAPLDGNVLWSIPMGPQKYVRQHELGGGVGSVLVVGQEYAGQEERPAGIRVMAVSLTGENFPSRGQPTILWDKHIEAAASWTTDHGISCELVNDHNGDQVRELAIAGRDSMLYLLDGKNGDLIDSIQLYDSPGINAPNLYHVGANGSIALAFCVYPGQLDENPRGFPTTLVIGSVDVTSRKMTWEPQLFPSVGRISAIDLNSDQQMEFYLQVKDQWEVLNAVTGETLGGKLPWSGKLDKTQNLPQSPYFADIDNDGLLEMIEIPIDPKLPAVARNLSRGKILWKGVAGLRARQPNDVAGRWLRSPHGELIGFGHDSMMAIRPSDGQPEWTLEGRPEEVLVGPWNVIGDDEIFVRIQKRGLVCLTADGTEAWRLHTPLEFRPAQILPDIDQDGLNEIVVNKPQATLGLVRGPRILWSRRAIGPLLASPQIADFDRDGTLEVCQVGSWDSNTSCRCFDGRDGAVRWSLNDEIPNNRAQAISNWDGDQQGTLEYVLLGYGAKTKGSYLSVFRGDNGRPVVEHRLGRSIALYTTPGIGDFNGDGHSDVAAVRYDSRDIVAIDGHHGKYLWRYVTRMGNIGGVAIGDINEDGRDNVIATVGYRDKLTGDETTLSAPHGKLIALRSSKAKQEKDQPLWKIDLGLPMRAPPRLKDLNGNGRLEVLAISHYPAERTGSPSRPRLVVASHDGQKLWMTAAGHAIDSQDEVQVHGHPATVEVDGQTWIITPMGNDGLVAFNFERRTQVWQTTSGLRVTATPVVVDLDKDGIQEVVATTADGEVVVFDLKTGSPFWRLRVSTDHISGKPAVGDLNGDGIQDIVVADHGFSLTVISGKGVNSSRARFLARTKAK